MEQTVNDLIAQFFLQMADAQATTRQIIAECEARGQVIAARDAKISELEKAAELAPKK